MLLIRSLSQRNGSCNQSVNGTEAHPLLVLIIILPQYLSSLYHVGHLRTEGEAFLANGPDYVLIRA